MGKSKLTPYWDEISTMILSGATYERISDYLYEKYELDTGASNICQYATRNGLHSRVDIGKNVLSRVCVPFCEDCDKCEKVVGFRPDTVYRLCLEANRLIDNHVVSSPIWCNKR